MVLSVWLRDMLYEPESLFLKGASYMYIYIYQGFYILYGTTIGVTKGDTRNLDRSSYEQASKW